MFARSMNTNIIEIPAAVAGRQNQRQQQHTQAHSDQIQFGERTTGIPGSLFLLTKAAQLLQLDCLPQLLIRNSTSLFSITTGFRTFVQTFSIVFPDRLVYNY